MNRYAPPTAELEDPKDADSPRSAASIQVRRAVWLLAAALVLGAIKSLLVPVPGPWWIVIATLAALAAITMATTNGMNWATVVFVALFLLGLPGMFFMRDLLLHESLFSLEVLAAQTVLQFSAALLLLLPPSNAWFRNRGKFKKLDAP